MPDVLRTEALTKFYGRERGIVDVDFSVQGGEVFGFLGPNGAGKTTTMRTILDFIRPTRGRATVFGLDSHASSREIRRRTGYLPGELSLYDNLTGEEHLRYLANLRGGVDDREVERLARLLGADLGRRIKTLSHGNKQKIGVILAMMHRPELLLLDEPTAALDPLVQEEVHQLIREAREDGRTVFLSSHILPEVEELCDRVGIIREGRVVAVEHIAELKARALRRLEIRFAEPVPASAFEGLAGVQDVDVRDSVLRCTVSGSLDAVVKAAARFRVDNVITQEPSLEEVFFAFYGDAASPGKPDGEAPSAAPRGMEAGRAS
ncbi:MAG TPA: ABC transporter ATP-binding protein [Actinomycetota bacterium]|nr:ABC transporter ATP-binding protein [Actinomycetota bacterium]